MFNLSFANGTNSISDPTNDRIVGLLFIITSVCSLIVYVPILVVMNKSKALSSACYTFMISLGISDVISLVGWIIIGIHTLTHGSVVPELLITVTLCVLVIGWGSLTMHLAMIAVNRYIAVCHSQRLNSMFQRRNVIILLCVSWFYAVFVHATPTFIPPNMVYSMDGYGATWVNDDVTRYYTIEDITCCSTVSVISIFCYSAIIIKYTKVRRQVNPPVSPATPTLAVAEIFKFKAKREGRRQFKLALQTAIRCVTFLVYDLLYYVVSLYSTNMWAVFVCSTYLWCFNNALNPWIYIMFNEQLRSSFKRHVLDHKLTTALVNYHQAISLRTLAKITVLLKR